MSSESGSQRRSSGEMAIVVCFVIFTSIYLYQSFFLERTLLSDFVGPAMFPQLLAGTALLLSAIYFIQLRFARREVPAEGAATDDFKGTLASLMTLIPIIFYVLLLEPLGFLFSTAAYVFVAMLSFGQHWTRAATYALTMSVAFFILFYYALLSHIPMGTVIETERLLPFLGQLRRVIEG